MIGEATTQTRFGAELPRVRLEARLQGTLAFPIAYLAMAVAGIAVAFMQPVWQLTDEAQHTDVLAQYAHGVYPVEGVTTLRPETVAVMVATGNYRWSPPETQPAPTVVNPSAFTPPPVGLSDYDFKLWVRRHIWWFSYEAMQPPLFYLAATPVWMLGQQLGGPFAGVYAVRLLNCLLLALLAPMTLATARLLAPRRLGLQIAAVAFTVALPGLLLNGSQVTNDTLGAVLGSLTCLLAVRLARAGWSLRGAALLGAVFGLTLLTKLTDAGLSIGLVAAWLWPVLRQGAPRLRQLGLGALAAGAALAVMAPWFVLNLRVYGHPAPTGEAARLLGAGTSSGTYSIFQSADYAWETFWSGEHWDTLPLTGAASLLMCVVMGAAVVGIARVLRGTVPGATPRPALWILCALAGGQVVWGLAIPAASGIGGMTPGRYLYPVVAPVMALTALGLWTVIRAQAARAAVVAGFVALSAVNFVAYGMGYTAVPHEWRLGPPTDLAVTDLALSGSFDGVHVDVDRAVVDPRSAGVWLHLHVRNGSGGVADWWSGPALRASNGLYQGVDFAGSTPFPETLPAGSEYWGWVRLHVKPSQLPQHGSIEVLFQDVATRDYQAVGSIPLPWYLP